MANNIADQICDAVDVLINKRVSSLQFDKTVRATVLSVEDASIGKYRVQYQNNTFYAYADPETTYKPKAEVYVEIPSSDYNKTKLIIGSVKKLGGQFLSAVTAQGKMTKVGTNIFTNYDYEDKSISFCSYDGQQEKDLLSGENPFVSINEEDLTVYKEDMLYFMLGATIQTSLPVEQQVGAGNYGLILEVDYYTAAQRESLGDQRSVITRTYVLDVNNMLGQPYKYLLPDRQYAIFPIDGNNLKEIKSLKAFCEGFPVTTRQNQPQDIFLSNIELIFLDALGEEELSNASLKILTPYGSYFTSVNDDTKYLEAELKLKGKIVNFKDQKVDFYWFVKDTGVTANDQFHYSIYAGQGWRCLNEAKSSDKLTQFIPEGPRKHITVDMAPADITTFKCVAVYNDTTLSDTIKIKNNVAKTKISISSTAGTQFYFDTGKTTLTCAVQTDKSNLSYSWAYRVPTGRFVSLTDNTAKIENVSIAIATSFITYECTVYYYDNDAKQNVRLGSAEITLINGIPQNEYTLVINNGTQVFKYDEYGVSPASRSAAAADKIIIPTLSFDIYNDLGQLVTPVNDADKVRLCDIKWVWPEKKYTMLTLDESLFALEDDLIVNPTTNGNVLRKIISNTATLTFGIKNRFDLDANDNNIQLEVNFQGHNLVTSTNFTFVKEGNLGTNGTKYISRLIPIRDRWEKVYLQNGYLFGWNDTITKIYNAESGVYDRTQTFNFEPVEDRRPLKVQLWNGSEKPVYDSTSNENNIAANLTWQIVDVGAAPDRSNPLKKETWHNAEVAADGTITTEIINSKDDYNNVPTVIKTTISTSELDEQAQKYYATYPLDVSFAAQPQKQNPGEGSGQPVKEITTFAIVTGGFSQCMYNSDGTRGTFKTKPFTFRIFKKDRETDPSKNLVNEQNLIWTVSWYNNQKNDALRYQNNIEINPPAFFDSTTTNNYIRVDYSDEDGEYVVILSIHLYLNRYGMAAMNDWDGTSIKLNTQGDQYILAPQIGAGQKNDDNSFTGITMGKSFNVDGNAAEPEIGLMGFKDGARSIFLDSKTGRAEFGVTGPIGVDENNEKIYTGKIIISPTEYGAAPPGALYSHKFYTDYDSSGRPGREWRDDEIKTSQQRENKGMLIDLTTPSIRFGNKNFSVDAKGHLTAKGGGSIAGWEIEDDNLHSANNTLWLDSGLNDEEHKPKIYSGSGNNKHDSLESFEKGFYLSNDGLSIHNTIRISEKNNVGKIEVGNLRGSKKWTITGTNDNSYISYGTSSFDDSGSGQVYLGTNGIRLGGSFKVTPAGYLTASSGNIAGWEFDGNEFSGGEVTLNKNGTLSGTNWQIASTGVATFKDVRIENTNNESYLMWGSSKDEKKFYVNPQGQMYAYEGKIGPWNLTQLSFEYGGGEGDTKIKISPTEFTYGQGFNYKPDGTGQIGNCKFGKDYLAVDGGLQLNDNQLYFTEVDYIVDITGVSIRRDSFVDVPVGFSVGSTSRQGRGTTNDGTYFEFQVDGIPVPQWQRLATIQPIAGFTIAFTRGKCYMLGTPTTTDGDQIWGTGGQTPV